MSRASTPTDWRPRLAFQLLREISDNKIGWPRLGSARASGLVCVAGMLLGLIVDLGRSPTGTIPELCSGGIGLAQRILAHVTMMPFAHSSMLLGLLLCLIWHVFLRSLDIPAVLVRLAVQLGQMAAVEGGSLLLTGNAKPLFSMAVMGGLTLLPDLLIGTEELISLRRTIRECIGRAAGAR